MKKQIFIILPLVTLMFTACKKNSEHSPSATTSTNSTSESITYKALDGSRAQATFDNDNGKKTITIKANNNKFQLDLVDETHHGSLYERNGVKAIVKGDSISLEQGDNIIPLVKDN